MVITAGSRGRRVSRRFAVDAALAAGALLFGLVAGSQTPPDAASPTLLVALAVLGVVPIALRRVAPLTAVIGVCVTLGLTAWLHDRMITGIAAMFVVAYTQASLRSPRPAVLSVVAIGVADAAAMLVSSGADPARLGPVAASQLALVACFFLGRTVYTRRAYMVALEERARAAEATREAVARQAVLDERQRIARELHDMVAHHISVMGVLATGARRALHRDPAVADETLATIERTGRATLREMRRLLDVLRSDQRPDPGPAAPEPPTEPGVAGLERLVDQVREAGLPVTLTVTGPPRTLEPGIDLAVYRIVQEALTNTLKHAGPARAQVTLRFTADALRLAVTDDGRGPAPGRLAPGHGLVGMRERVALYGGTLRTGARGGGGFAIAAELPLDPADHPVPGPPTRTVVPTTEPTDTAPADRPLTERPVAGPPVVAPTGHHPTGHHPIDQQRKEHAGG